MLSLNATIATAAEEAPHKWATYVPKDWRLLLNVEGDLTGDNKPETVIVVEQQDPDLITGNDQLGSPKLNLNPRRLIILSPTQNGYRAIQSVEGFLPSENDDVSTCLADPLMENGGIEIKRGVLSITLNYWLSCGSYGVTTNIYRFRQQGSRFRLIGKDTNSYSRSSGMGDEVSINYLTGRKKETTGITVIGPDEGVAETKPKTRWSRIKADEQFLDSITTDE